MTARPRFLVTAGSTREMIDRVRDWGNVFTGKTGLAIARALAPVGEVELLTSSALHRDLLACEATAIRVSGFISHAELEHALADRMLGGEPYDGVFMTAAVSDYAPSGVYEVIDVAAPGDLSGLEHWVVRPVQAAKVKSSFNEIAVRGKRTLKLVDLFRTKWRFKGLLVKFKLEVGIGKDELIRVGQASRVASGADYLVANTLDMVSGDGAGAFLLGVQSEQWVPRAQLADRLARLAEEWVRTHGPAGRT